MSKDFDTSAARVGTLSDVPRLARHELVHLRAHWWWFTLLGALLVICGTAAIIFPHLTVITTFAVAALLGVMLMIGGVATIIGAFWAGRWSGFLIQLPQVGRHQIRAQRAALDCEVLTRPRDVEGGEPQAGDTLTRKCSHIFGKSAGIADHAGFQRLHHLLAAFQLGLEPPGFGFELRVWLARNLREVELVKAGAGVFIRLIDGLRLQLDLLGRGASPAQRERTDPPGRPGRRAS